MTMPGTNQSITAIIAGGGTGGHVYPGIAVAQELMRRDPANKVIFIGTEKGLETRIVPAEGFPLELIQVFALKRVGWRAGIRSLLALPRTFVTVRRMLRRIEPDLVVGVGGYASGPVVLMAALMGIPTMVAEQNAMPGFTNRILARFIDAAAVSFEEARRYFRKRAEVTGNPVRNEFFEVPVKEIGEVIHVLITGGSQGARAINEAMIGALPLLQGEGCRLSFTHQTGQADYERVLAAYRESSFDAEVKPFIDRMVGEFTRADLVICRAGATTVAELAAAGKPALLIPFPFAADDHQRKNAEAVQRGGAGRMILQAELTAEKLAQELVWLARDPQQLQRMAEASRQLRHPRAAARVVDLGLGIVNARRESGRK